MRGFDRASTSFFQGHPATWMAGTSPGHDDAVGDVTACPQRSVSFSSMRAVALVGFLVAGCRAAGIRRSRLPTSRCAAAGAKSDIAPPRSRAPRDNSQFDLNCGLLKIGRTSVWPSTLSTQAISAGICRSRSISAGREFIQLGAALGQQQGLSSVSKNTSD